MEVLLTGDQTLGHEQNLWRGGVARALSAIQLPILRENIAAILRAIAEAAPGSFRLVECGVFSRKRPRPPVGFNSAETTAESLSRGCLSS